MADSQVAGYNTFQDINYFLVLNFCLVTPDGQKARHMSPPCIGTGVLNNILIIFITSSIPISYNNNNILIIIIASSIPISIAVPTI